MSFFDRGIIELNDNGAWSWFMDERVIVHNGRLLVGSIRSTEKMYHNGTPEPGQGNCELAVHDLATGETHVVVLHEQLEQDDHNGPALQVRPDGRVLAVYTQHSQERKVYWRVSESPDLREWGPIRELITPGVDHPPFGGDNVTYSNLFLLSVENNRLYNFFRSLGHQQNYMVSEDNGDTWTYGGMFLQGYSGYAPYFKYATDGVGTIHFIGTEDHPRNFDNSVYHGFVRNGQIHQSDGTVFGPLSRTRDKSGDIWDLTTVFRGGPDDVAWVTDLHLDSEQHPVCLFSVQKDGRGLPKGQGGSDHRYHYARWDGSGWIQHEIAYGGTRLYPDEDDYTGLAALDPQSLDSVYVSTDAHPTSGEPLVSKTDGRRHHELFRGVTA
ncbi:MAG: BNR-4 repeat-containing protein, partial [Fibrella sp.]|nr:BNR-4 repeat-containing protein [Armatimonadota bacterium]